MIATLTAVVLSSAAAGQDAGKINVIMYERDPWLMVIGSDSPSFINYADGLTIYRALGGAKKQVYYAVTLTARENAGLLKRISILDKMQEHYSISHFTDQPMLELYYRKQDQNPAGILTKRTVYGRLAKHSADRNNAPTELVQVYDYLTGFNHKHARPWAPQYLEVMIWPYDYAPDKSIVWHKDWPDINSKSSRKRGDSYSIYLPYAEKAAFERFIHTRREKGAVLINGKKWAIATRIPFPHEMPVNKGQQQPVSPHN